MYYVGCHLSPGSVVPGAGAFEIAAYHALSEFKKTIKGRARLGVQAYANALLVIPKTLAKNSGFDPQDTIVKLEVSRCSVSLDRVCFFPVVVFKNLVTINIPTFGLFNIFPLSILSFTIGKYFSGTMFLLTYFLFVVLLNNSTMSGRAHATGVPINNTSITFYLVCLINKEPFHFLITKISLIKSSSII